jgi:hypothetical protein
LKQEPDGHVYLSIATNYSLVDPLLSFFFSEVVPRHFKQVYFSPELGVHCTVMSPAESARCKALGLQRELGKKFSFHIKGCYASDVHSDSFIEKAWFLLIDCPELEQLREYYLLPARPAGHEFHVTLLMKKKTSSRPKPHLCRLNVSCFAA